MLFPFFLFFWQRKDWALIRKTQSHIITLDKTKEDNPVVRFWYFVIELNYSCFLTNRGALAFVSGDATSEFPLFSNCHILTVIMPAENNSF